MFNVSMKAVPSTWVTCHSYPDRTPILVLHDEHGSLAVYTSAGERSAESDQKFARELVRAATEFLAEVERLRVEPESSAVQ